MLSIEPVSNFIRRCQNRLDQEEDTSANLWEPSELVEYLNEGIREVWQAVRETHQNWSVREMTSTDPIQRIGGREYNPNALQLVTQRDRLHLPPDFRELLFLEGVPPQNSQEIPDQFFPVIRFEYKNLTQRQFRQDVLNRFNTNTRVYMYDVIYSPAEGPYLLLSPALALNETLEARIQYIAAPPQLLADGTFEGLGYTLEMVDACLAYVCYAAATKEDLAESIGTFERVWNLKRELAMRSAGPKQTRDEETVEGYLEDEL